MKTQANIRILATAALVFCLLAAFASAVHAEEPFFKLEEIFPFDESRPANHASTIAAMPNGDLLATWFGGSREGMPDVAVWASRKPAGAESWTKPEPLVDTPEIAEGNSLLFTDSKGTVWLFFVRKYDPAWAAWDKAKIFVKTSTDSGTTWSDERVLKDELGWMIRNNAVELQDGRLILPIYTDTLPMQSMIWISSDGFKTFEERRVPVTTPENLQPALVSLGGERLLMYCRHHTVPGKIWTASSDDLGKTWHDVKKTKLSNPDAGVSMIRLASGALVLAFNDNYLTRTPMTLAISDDEGKTWKNRKDIETASKEFSYPFLVQTPDGRIHLTYTADDRRIIKHAEFNEEWLRKGK